MEDKVFIENGTLQIHYEVFSPFEFRKKIIRDDIPLDQINFIIEHVGVKGGSHGFDIMSFEKENRKVPITSDRYVSEYKTLHAYGKRSGHILEGIKKLLPDLKIQSVVEKGSAYV